MKMANEVETQLVDALYDELQTERFATISTIDFETNGPNVSAISWLVAPTKQKNSICRRCQIEDCRKH